MVLLGQLLAPALEVLAVDLRLLELGPGAAVLEPHLHLPRPEAQAVGQGDLLLLGREKTMEISISYFIRPRIIMARRRGEEEKWKKRNGEGLRG